MTQSREQQIGLWAWHRRPVPLLGVTVTAVVQASHAAVALRQRYRNDEARPIEAIYTMPLPAGAALTRLSVEAGGRRIDGEVRERAEAFRVYDEAVAAGHGAALLEQERDEIATVRVGNVLPREEVVVEIEYIEPLEASEGALRWRLPTRVAPRYIPGAPTGVRSEHGAQSQTDRVPDADRISPPETGWIEYLLTLDLLVDLGTPVTVESPSHRLRVQPTGGDAARVSLERGVTTLDRDLVVLIQTTQPTDRTGAAAVLTAHRDGDDEPGVFALTLVPDLALRVAEAPRSVVLLLDVSGSMAGASLEQAVAAARLCLRHLRPGDLFALLAFSTEVQRMDGRGLRVFDEASLRRADRWLLGLEADGGTELQAPLVEALTTAGEGIVILLTDGQVADEAAIFRASRETGSQARVYGFGVGTNVCEGLLRDLARASGGAVEFIHPGESIDRKVVGQFARATAPRVDGVDLLVDGVVVDGLAPSSLPPLIDGEPWALLGRYHAPGEGRVLLVGRLAGEPFELQLSVHFPDHAVRPVLPRLWARARIRDLEQAEETDETRWQIVSLATHHGLASRHTSLVVVEQRQGERLAPGLPPPRVVSVQGPRGIHITYAALSRYSRVIHHGALRGEFHYRAIDEVHDGASTMDYMLQERERGITLEPPPAPMADEVEVLQGQGASGLWGGDSPGAQVSSTARALVRLAELGVTTEHALHGVPVRKAITALLEALVRDDVPAELREAALAAAWRVASGRRAREAVRQAAEALGVPSIAAG